MFKKNAIKLILLLFVILSVLVFAIPLHILELLSMDVVGGPPINGKSWLEGVRELGGELSMRILAMIGLAILILTTTLFLKQKGVNKTPRKANNKEIALFLLVAIGFFFVNLFIAYSWWDPDAFLGMGPLFFHSIISLIALGLLPYPFKRAFHFTDGFANSKDRVKINMIFAMLLAYGYGLVSTLWHCCSFYSPKLYFFFFVIKLIQLWAVCSFFFKYGFKLFYDNTKPWVAYLTISVLFGFCYPWHTFAFAITFVFFGFALCYLVRKTDSYLPGLALLYLSYVFHAGLPWQGAYITFVIIYPITIAVLLSVLIANFKNKTFKRA